METNGTTSPGAAPSFRYVIELVSTADLGTQETGEALYNALRAIARALRPTELHVSWDEELEP